ncbi:MAG: universal stress protein [Gammaproteobacteria bacterium]|nr:universal stress protein [Gammaproteobacteria bacterium]
MAYKHVLAAVDTSEEAREVIERAKALAEEHKAKLSICSVVRPITHVYGGLDMMAYSQASVNFEEEALAQARKHIETEADRVQVKADDVHVGIGAPAPQIVDTAETLGADLIVVGSHGKHGLGLLLGSTANGVLHQAGCDVLTVRIQS